MIYFNNGRRNLAAPKAACTFEFTLPSGQLTELPGSLILGRPEVRLSKLR
jgi:RNase P/RNase MRP subunit p29